MNKKNIKLDKLNIIVWCIFILFCIPFVVSTRYTVFWTDDFSDARRAAAYGGNIVYNAAMSTGYMYQTFQGTFASIFLQTIFSPLLLGGGLPVLRLISVVNIVLFLIASYYIFRTVINHLNIDSKNTIVFLLAIIIPLLTYKSYAEILYWYTGQTTYTYPLSCGLIAISLMFSINKSSNNKVVLIFKYIVSAVLLTYGCGGSLQISGIICYLILILPIIFCLYSHNHISMYLMKKWYKEHVEYIVLFLFSLIITLINLLAPGNFSRHDGMGQHGKGVVKATYYSIQLICKEFEFYFKETTFIVFFLIAVILGLLSVRKISTSKFVFGIFISMTLSFVSVFPVVLGYNYDYAKNYFPPRVQFIFDFMFIISVIIFGYMLGMFVYTLVDGFNLSIVALLLCMLGFFYALTVQKPDEDYIPFKVAESIVTGDLKDCADRITNAYKAVEESTESDVAVLYPEEAIEWFSVVTLSDSPSDWFNQALSAYYGKNSVAFYREIDCE